MKTLVPFLLCGCFLLTTQLFAQTEEAIPNKTRTTIIIKTVDEDGTENTQTITEEGKVFDFKMNTEELELKDLDIFIKEAKKGGKLRFELEGDVQAFNFDVSDIMDFNRGDCDQPFLGIMMIQQKTFDDKNATNSHANRNGVLINKIIKDTGAEDAGLLADDVLTMIDGKPMTSLGEVIKEIKSHKVNDQITVTYLREGQESQVVATLKGKKCPTEKVFKIEKIV
ncbi:MAG: PDZ domain-containing protein, partial [Saprospiraceae bacterium]